MAAWNDLAIVADDLHRELRGGQEAKDLARWRGDPCAFFLDVFGIKPWRRQREILESVRDNRRTAVRSGHKVAKSNSAAGVGIWWVATRPQGRVITTATTGRQIRAIIWREVRAMHRASLKQGRLMLPRPAIQPVNGLRYDDGREFVGFTAEDTESMSGLSGPDMLFIVDEASGVAEDIFVAIRGNMAGGASLLLISNPSQSSGTFYDAFHDHSELYNCIHVSSEESPNILSCTDDEVIPVPEEDIIPGLARAEYVLESRIEYGPDWQHNPLYHVRVKGNFPHQSSMCVVGAGAVASAIAGWLQAVAEGPIHIGLDVAHFGDDETCMVLRRGYKVLTITTVHGNHERQTCQLVVEAIRTHWKFGEDRVTVKVDSAGGYGTEVVSRLSDTEDPCWTHDLTEVDGEWVWTARKTPNPWGTLRPPVQVVEVNVATKSTVVSPRTGDPEYVNLRSQIWFGIAEWLKAGGTLPDDKRLQTELVSPTYTLPKNQRAVESKKDIKKRLGRSPDRADALGLCVYEGEDTVITGSVAANDYPDEWGGHRGYG